MPGGKWIGRGDGDKVGMEFAITYNMVRKHVFDMILEQSPKGNEGWSHVAISGTAFKAGGEASTETTSRSIIGVLEEL